MKEEKMFKMNLFKLFSVSILVFSLFACKKEIKVAELTTTTNKVVESVKEETTTAVAENVAEIVVPQNLKDLYNQKSLGIKSVKNVRQLGGYVTKDGKKVKDGLLLRGAHLARISDEDIAIFKDKYNLKEIIDFRVAEERDPVMDREIEGVNNTWIVVTEVEKIMNRLENVCEDRDINMMATYYKYNGGINSMYSHLVKDDLAHKGYNKFFKILLNNDGATYWHCSGGKDRTGFGAVLLLSLFGVDEKTILDDYEASIITKEQQMNAAIKALKEKGYNENDTSEIVNLVGVNRKAMENALRVIDNEYNGMNAYLHNQIGLTDEDIENLKNKYLEKQN